jgi:hypothetical protein
VTEEEEGGGGGGGGEQQQHRQQPLPLRGEVVQQLLAAQQPLAAQQQLTVDGKPPSLARMVVDWLLVIVFFTLVSLLVHKYVAHGRLAPR